MSHDFLVFHINILSRLNQQQHQFFSPSFLIIIIISYVYITSKNFFFLPFLFFSSFLLMLTTFIRIENGTEPITQILGVREGDPTGEIFINMGSTINLTCIVRNLPEPPSIQWTHNGEVRIKTSLFIHRSNINFSLVPNNTKPKKKREI